MLEKLGVQHTWVLTVMLARNMDCGRLWGGGGAKKSNTSFFGEHNPFVAEGLDGLLPICAGTLRHWGSEGLRISDSNAAKPGRAREAYIACSHFIG